jgi:hypothetical protein
LTRPRTGSRTKLPTLICLPFALASSSLRASITRRVYAPEAGRTLRSGLRHR